MVVTHALLFTSAIKLNSIESGSTAINCNCTAAAASVNSESGDATGP